MRHACRFLNVLSMMGKYRVIYGKKLPPVPWRHEGEMRYRGGYGGGYMRREVACSAVCIRGLPLVDRVCKNGLLTLFTCAQTHAPRASETSEESA